MKVIAKQLLGPRAVQQVVAENRILQQVQHPYIVPLHFSFQDDVNFYLLFAVLGDQLVVRGFVSGASPWYGGGDSIH